MRALAPKGPAGPEGTAERGSQQREPWPQRGSDQGQAERRTLAGPLPSGKKDSVGACAHVHVCMRVYVCA